MYIKTGFKKSQIYQSGQIWAQFNICSDKLTIKSSRFVI